MKRFLLLMQCVSLSIAPLQAGQVVINEIHFEIEDNTVHQEFIELYNAGTTVADLSGWFFSSGIRYAFPPGTMVGPEQFLLVAENPTVLASSLGAPGALGPWEGGLSNDGERIVLRNPAGEIEDEVNYGVGFPWPFSSAGRGCSMELINPSLDNDLGGSWRPSGWIDPPDHDRIPILDSGDPQWHYRIGTSEASSPASAWRERSFTEDASWLVGQTVVGFGDGGEKVLLSDMKGLYSSVYFRHAFTIPPGEVPSHLLLALWVDDGAMVWINGTEVARVRVRKGDPPLFNGTADRSIDAKWEEFLLKDAASWLVDGENILAVHALNQSILSPDFAFDAKLLIPGRQDFKFGITGPPTPGRKNGAFSANAPPQVRQVRHLLAQPMENEDNVVTAKITDPDGIRSATLFYQVVLPGQYIPAFLPVPLASLMSNPALARPPNPAFEDLANWVAVIMTDDGNGRDAKAADGIYTAVIPGQVNRALVRYRIAAVDALGANLRAPFVDDPSLNFAFFVYNGVPNYEAKVSILGKPTLHDASDLVSLAVYFLITRSQDLLQCIAANAGEQIPQGNLARSAENWEGAFVYNGVVYDHINYRLRGANGRYQVPPTNPGNVTGKRHWHFRFNKGRPLQADDRFGNPYPTPWKTLITGRMFGNRLDGNWGLNEQVNDIIWRANGVPAPYGHSFHWRVVDGPEEAPVAATGQYLGDFWGLAWAQENYDVNFLDAHGLAKGNLYKLVNQTNDPLQQERYQAPYAVKNGGDHNNIEGSLRPTQSEAWLLAYVDYDEWYRYHALVQAFRHYDYWPDANKNAAWYFEPLYLPANKNFGIMHTFPFDTDATWGPTWNDGRDWPYESIYGSPGKPNFQRDYRNAIREVRDLLWQKDQLEPLIRQVAAFMAPMEKADIDRWRNAPAEAGRQYFAGAGESTLLGKVNDMLKYAFTGGSWEGGGVGAGGRAAFLDSFADGADASLIPKKPTISYSGPAGFPMDRLSFIADAFSDPQGAQTFKAMKWRIARTSALASPGSIPLLDLRWRMEPVPLELHPIWESGEITEFLPDVTIPLGVVEEGAMYRVRVRMEDATGRWSHWSAPVEFIAGPPSASVAQIEGLRITEILPDPQGGSDFEFIELENRGASVLDLTDVSIGGGISFSFRDSAVTSLDPGQIVVVVADQEVFSRRYDTSSMLIAGQYSGNLGNGVERIILTFGKSLDILDFTYDGGWVPSTVGPGHSLNIRSLDGLSSSWGDPQSWMVGSRLHGTPGLRDPGMGRAGRLRPGDANLDGRLSLGDPVVILLRLFIDGTAPPPCEGGGLAEGGNLWLLDADGNRAIDVADAIRLLAYLYLSGPPHVLGADCTPIVGCSDACR